ncbi:MAG: 1-acyl-sn-glycerol-3-phosphate acyltransferase, partial [Bacteroides sp.]|nr:1-acyl-sn-glycerol-3-phosphate acyltransferase [Bacteroides sp.]
LLVVTIVAALSTILGSMLGFSRSMGYWPGHIWARIFCFVSFVRVKVSGRENIDARTSYVFVANHQGAYDIFSIYGYLGHNFRWMMKKGLMKIPLGGYSCKASGHILVDNSTPSATRTTMATAKKQLSGGMSVVVFPEGARTTDGRMHPFRRGAYSLAMEFGLPVVPVTIDGSFQILPRTDKWIHRHRMILTIHDPIPPKGQGTENIKATMAEAYVAVESALPEEYKGMVKNDDQ